MPAKNSDWDSSDLDQRQPTLELLGAVAHEARPALGARE